MTYKTLEEPYKAKLHRNMKLIICQRHFLGVCVCGGGGALLSIPHETQWTIQALPTALSVQQQYQR